MPVSDPTSRRWRPWRVLTGVGLALCALLALLYAAAPWLVAALAPRFAADLGLDSLRVEARRPGLDTLALASVELTSGRVHAAADGVVVRYRPGGLLAARVESVEIERLALRIDDAAAERAAASSAPPPDLAELFAALPAERVTVRALALEVPALEFRGAGSMELSAERLEARMQGLQPPLAEGFLLQARVAADGLVDVRLAGPATDQAPLLEVRSELGGDRLAMTGTLALRGFATALAANLAGLPAGPGSVTGTFDAALPWPPPEPFEPAALTAAGRLAVTWNPTAEPWSLTDATLNWQLADGALAATAAAAVGFRGRALEVRGEIRELRPEPLTGAGSVSVALDPDGAPMAELTWTLASDALDLDAGYRVTPSVLALLAEGAGGWGEGELSGRIRSRLPWPLPASLDQLHPPASGSLTGRWGWPAEDLAVRLRSGSWQLADGRLSGSLQTAVRQANYSVDATVRLDDLLLDGDRVTARGSLAAGPEALVVEVVADHDLASAVGTAQVTGEAILAQAWLAGLIGGWDQPFDIDAGTLTLAGRVGWDPAGLQSAAFDADLAGVAGHFEDYTFTGLAAAPRLTLDAAGAVTLAPLAVTVASVDTGVTLDAVTTDIAWQGDVLQIGPGRADLLGGEARTEAFAYTLSGGAADFGVTLDGLDLQRVLALEGEHIAGSGVIDGTLPVRVRNAVPEVNDGRIRARAPGGVIRVSSGLAGGTGQPGLDFALRALQDFRYALLEADVTYTGDGDLTLAVHLQGRNPEIEGGRPIHYNVNVNENIPTLLESLRLQDELAGEIERRITD